MVTVLLASVLAGMAFAAQPLNITVSPSANLYLDANQGIMNFNATASGGTPFPGQNSTYTYQWYALKNTSCPGINPLYKYQIPMLSYAPTSETTNCIVVAQATDYFGNTVFGLTGIIVVNPSLKITPTLSRSGYNVTQGQSITISANAPINGTAPYNYQWFAATSVGGLFRSSTANALCAVNPNTLNCVFTPNVSTQPGLYELELRFSDSAYVPAVLVSTPIIVRVVALAGANAVTTSTTTTANTTTSSTVKTTSSVSTVPTTSIIYTPVPATPIAQATKAASTIWSTAVSWLDTALRYIV